MQHNPARLFDTAVQIDRSKNSFQRIYEQSLFGSPAGLLFAFPQFQVIAQMHSPGILHEIGGADEETFQPRELAFGQRRMGPKKIIADQKSQDRVAKKFELLVVSFSSSSLVGMRAVGQGLCQ